jgi:hypothetical protein
MRNFRNSSILIFAQGATLRSSYDFADDLAQVMTCGWLNIIERA